MQALPEDELKQIRDAHEDYLSTVQAMLAFSAFVVHDATAQRPGSHVGFGRRMTTSATNAILPSDNVTPDVVAQKSAVYGVVAEVKRSLPLDRSKWPEILRQLRKYDDDLTGWWTENERIASSDTTLLLHQTRSRAVTAILDKERKKNAQAIGPRTSLIEFNRSNERQTYYFFRLEWGAIRDADLSQRLTEGVNVPILKVISTFSNVLFYDADPPIEYLLVRLWTDYFASCVAHTEYDPNLKARPIDVSASTIARELQQAYGSRVPVLEPDERSAEFPNVTIVRKALDALVKIRLAIPLPNTGEYRVLYRELKDDILHRFASLLRTPSEKVAAQAELFPEQLAVPLPPPKKVRTKRGDSDEKTSTPRSRTAKKSPSK